MKLNMYYSIALAIFGLIGILQFYEFPSKYNYSLLVIAIVFGGIGYVKTNQK